MTHSPKRKRKRPSRRWPTERDFKVRSAKNEDGPAISALLYADGIDFRHLDWSNVGSSWLVADREGTVIGAIQFHPGKPIGRVEMLTLDRTRSKTLIAKGVKALFLKACTIITMLGSQEVQCLMPANNINYLTIIERYGARRQAEGILYTRTLSELAIRYQQLAEELNTP